VNVFFQVTCKGAFYIFDPLVIGTTFSGSPSILTIFAGLSSLTKSVSKTCCPCIPLPACHPTT
jgi:hypothetical protein